MVKLTIPKISDAELLRRYGKIKPLIRIYDKVFPLREFSLEELRNYRFAYNLESFQDLDEAIPEASLNHIEKYDFLCFHRFGSLYLVKYPTVAEVLAQFYNFDSMRNAKYFEIVPTDGFEPSLLRKTVQESMMNYMLHISEVRVYGSK